MFKWQNQFNFEHGCIFFILDILIKHLIKQSFNLKIEEGLRQEKNNFYKIIKSKNGIEGINAFIEKRKPKFCD